MKNALRCTAAVIALATQPTFADGDSDNGRNYSDKSIKGTWTLAINGFTADSNALGTAPGTPLVAVATVTFDGKGGCESIDQIIVGGQYLPSRNGFRSTAGGTCSYSVNSDGTGFFDVVFPGAPVTNATLVISDKHTMDIIANNQGLGIFGSGAMKKQ